LSTHAKLDLSTLEQLRAISKSMLAFANLGDWDAVSNSDIERRQILHKQHDKCIEGVNQLSRKQLIGEILAIDIKIKELANNERKSLMDKELRQQAQIAAQTSYKHALTPDTGL